MSRAQFFQRQAQATQTLGRLVTAVSLALALLPGTSACTRPCASQPPYAATDAPTTETLLAASQPRREVIQFSKARVRESGQAGARLLLAVQAPDRLAGSVVVAGKELLSLTINEHAYGLRYLVDRGFQQGHYSGPPSACALETLLGVALAPRDAVRLLLGGAPELSGEYRVIERGWVGGASGYERLLLQTPHETRELRFGLVDARWHFIGATIYDGHGSHRRLHYAVDHHDFRSHDGLWWPKSTEIRQGEGKTATTVTLSYGEPDIAPHFATDASSEKGKGDHVDHVDHATTQLPPRDEDDWDDGGWETSEGEPVSSTPEPSTPDPSPTMRANSGIPEPFVLNSTGLIERGDLCRASMRAD